MCSKKHEPTDKVKHEVNVKLRERVPIKVETDKPRNRWATEAMLPMEQSSSDDSFEYDSDDSEELDFKGRRRKTEIVN